MASDEYYNNLGYPQFGSPGTSAPMRAEFVKVEAAFEKMPDLAGHADEVVVIKSDESGMDSVGTTGTGDFVRATDPTFVLTDTTTNNSTTSQHGWLKKLSGSTTQFMRGDGNWASAPTASMIPVNRSSDTTLVAADTSTFINYTSGTFTQTFTAAATLGSGWFIWLRNAGTGDITLDPNGAETIDGLTSFIMYPGEARLVMCTGTGFISAVATPFNKTFTSSDTFVKPPGYNYFEGELWGAGASGGRSGSATFGAGGGGGGNCLPFKVEASVVGTTETITIGAGGVGVIVAGNGNPGGNSTFGSLFTSYGGGAGAGDGTGDRGGGSGGGALGAGSTGTSSNAAIGGAPCSLSNSGATDSDGMGGGNGPSGFTAGGRAAWGGAGGGGGTQTDGGAGGASVYGGAGGGGSGSNPGAGGNSIFSGDGGAGSSSGNGVAGTAPGGGGGATKTGTASGAGARGECRIRGVC